jgi:hypothetical protein
MAFVDSDPRLFINLTQTNRIAVVDAGLSNRSLPGQSAMPRFGYTGSGAHRRDHDQGNRQNQCSKLSPHSPGRPRTLPAAESF